MESSAKTTRPRLPPVLTRRRLLRALDAATASAACAWIEGPAGAGKTTAALQWLEAAERPCLWYQVDGDDRDPVTVFHYLGVAAAPLMTSREDLPRPTPELRRPSERVTFARRYFEALCRAIPPRSALVFDGVHEVTPESALPELLALCADQLRGEQRLLCISRGAPARAFARRRAHQQLAHLRWDDLRLTLEEARGIAALHSPQQAATVDAIHEATQGWTAGLVVLLQSPRVESGKMCIAGERARLLYDYFATEVFLRLPEAAQSFLMKTAFLPELSVEAAGALTGSSSAEEALSRLVSGNHFTLEHVGRRARYEYHPLFRDFLRHRARLCLPTEELDRAVRGSARLAAQAGHHEEAGALLTEIGAFEDLAGLIRSEAPELVGRGRYGALRKWLEPLPSHFFSRDPWLAYWRGMVCAFFEPLAAEPFLATAYDAFHAANVAQGRLLAGCGVVDAILDAQVDFERMQPWLARLEQELQSLEGALDPDLEARLSGCMIRALLWSGADRARVHDWVTRGERCLGQATDPWARLRLNSGLVLFYLHGARLAEAERLCRAESKLIEQAGSPPGLAVRHRVVELLLSPTRPPGHDARALQEARALATRGEARVFEAPLLGLGAWSALSTEDEQHAALLLDEMSESLAGSPVNLDTSLWHANHSWLSRIRSQHAAAVERAQQALRIATQVGARFFQAFCHHLLGHALLDFGAPERAWQECSNGRALTDPRGEEAVGVLLRLLQARVAFARGDARAVGLLREGLATPRLLERLHYLPGWQRKEVSELFARALEHGVCVELVQEAIRRFGLAPPEGLGVHERWPMPLKVFTLGRFAVLVDGKALSFLGKAQKRPLELLKALIALGGRNVREELITEALWPDAEADAAARSLTSAIHRLRRLIGDASVLRQHGQLTLNAGRCWVDVWGFERRLSSLSSSWQSAEADVLAQKTSELLALYPRPFLQGEPEKPWVLQARQRLERRLVRLLRQLGQRHASDGAGELAHDCFQKVLDLQPEAEDERYHLAPPTPRPGAN